MRVDLFDYDLPADRIAQEPRPRGASRLLVLDRATGAIAHRRFSELPEMLVPGDLIVRNDVRVRPVRLYGRDEAGRIVEIFLLRPLRDDRSSWLALARPGRRAKAGRSIRFEEGLVGRVESVGEDGTRVVALAEPLDESRLERIGRTPLPPYIRREPGAPDRPQDREAYQTVFAKQGEAVAAPTAGLHFTPELFDRLAARGIEVADLTLSVGSGTFKPVTAEEAEAHRMDPEQVRLPAETAAAVSRSRAQGRRVVAVGTTVTRALEAWARMPHGQADPRFQTDLYILPGFEFRAVDVLLTNFHLPRSTLLMLVSAFAGRERIRAAYAEAIAKGYLFYSFGDAMLIV